MTSALAGHRLKVAGLNELQHKAHWGATKRTQSGYRFSDSMNDLFHEHERHDFLKMKEALVFCAINLVFNVSNKGLPTLNLNFVCLPI